VKGAFFHELGILVLVTAPLAGCVDKVALAGNTAANAFSCPRDQVVVTPLDEHNYRVAGCGKADLYYCHSYDVNPGMASQRVEWTCEPTEVALARSEHEDACARACNGEAVSCAEGCHGDSTCRSMCHAMGDGCFRGCTGN
jgi:hypothetical protein